MRNKKLIIVAALVLVAATTLCALAGCQNFNSAKILMSFEPIYTDKTVKAQELTKLTGCDNVLSLEEGILTASRSTNNHILYNIESDTIIASSDGSFGKIIDGIYYTANEYSERTYTFYDKNGVIKSQVKSGEFSVSGKMLSFSDGTVAVATDDGAIIIERNLYNATDIQKYAADVIYKNDKITVIGGEGAYMVLDAQGSFKNFVYLPRLINAAEEDDFITLYLGNGKIAIQSSRELTEVEAKKGYTYVEDGVYVLLNTYVYDFAKDKLKKVNFDWLLPDEEIDKSKDEDYALVGARQIVSKHLAAVQSIIVVDNNLKVRVKLNDIVDNAVDFAVADDSNYIIRDYVMTYVYDAKGKLVKNYVNVYSSYDGYIEVGNHVYDLKGNEVLKKTADMTIIKTTMSGMIYYTKERTDGSKSFCVFNSKTNNTDTYLNTNYQRISNDFFT